VLSFPRSVRIYLATQPADFRKGHHGLGGIIRGQLGEDPLNHVWVFHNKRRTDLKILWFDHGGFILAHKKLARGRFRIPDSQDGQTVRMTAAELAALLEGIDLSRCRRLKRWNPPET
jgi:transposase